MKKKIAVIGIKGLPAFGGAATVGENIIEQLKTKFDFTVYSISSHTDLSTKLYNGYKQIVFKRIPFKKLNVLYYYLISSIHALFCNYDLVHIHHRDASFIIPLLRLRFPVVLTTHGMILTEKWEMFKSLFSLQDRLFLRMANFVTCVSYKDLSIVRKFRTQRTVYIPNGVSPFKVGNNMHLERILLFAAGRIVPSKGCHIFLQSLLNLKYKDPVRIIGDFAQIKSYQLEIERLSIGLDVEFLGLIKDKSILYSKICESELFIYPSRIESMSMMLLEVSSLKIPIICSDIQENKDIFNDSEVLFFKTESVTDLEEKISWALRNRSAMIQKAENAFRKASTLYNWENISHEYESVFKKLV